jgi:hypothetical protein
MSIYILRLTLCEQFQSIGTMTTAQECIFARSDGRIPTSLVPIRREASHRIKKVRSLVDGAAINLLNIPETCSIQSLQERSRIGLHRTPSRQPDPPESIQSGKPSTTCANGLRGSWNG